MGQQEYDSFKQQLREWMDSHPAEYDWFEAEMNRKDDEGYQMVLMQAIALVPEYESVFRKRVNRSPDDNISDIEQLLKDSDLVRMVSSSFDRPFEESIVPAMFSWLYFGQSFERMVERGEELRKSPEIPTHQKMMIVQVIELLIAKSVELGLRAKYDWQNHYSLMQLADSDDIIGEILADAQKPNEIKIRGRQSIEMPLSEMFTPLADGASKMVVKIKHYLTTKHTQTDIAHLKIALDELQYLVSPLDIKAFRNALHEQYSPGINIIHERGIQNAYKSLTTSLSIGKRPCDVGEDRIAIDSLKALLSD